MKIQIINCLDLLYPYQIMRIVKKTSSCELFYDVKDKYVPVYSDVVIVLVKHDVQQVEEWLKSKGIDEKKVIWFVEEELDEKCCWVMPRAFEKEFDFEKLVQYLFFVANRNSEINLLISMKLSLLKVTKDTSISDCVDKVLKKYKKKDSVSMYVFVKDKVKRYLNGEDDRIPVQQFWMKGVGQEVDLLLCKRKSWAN